MSDKSSNKPNSDSSVDVSGLNALEQLLHEINNKLRAAEVLNGGFTEIKEKVSDISLAQIRVELELKNLQNRETSLKEKMDDINVAIYDPDHGIYHRINESITMAKIREEKLDKVSMQIDKLEAIITPIDMTDKSLKKIAGDNLQQIDSVVKTRKNLIRMFWIMTTALIAGALKIVWDFVQNFLN